MVAPTTSKEIPYLNKFSLAKFIINTSFLSPFKICRTVVRQILYIYKIVEFLVVGATIGRLNIQI